MNYTSVVAAVTGWIKPDDLSSMMSAFCTIAEARINRKLRVRQMETALAATAIDANSEIALPAGFVGTKALFLDGYEGFPLTPKSLETITADGSISGLARAYAVGSDSWLFDGTGTVAGVYYTAVPGLETSTTNCLATLYPDVYLWGMLTEASVYESSPDVAAQFEQRFNATIAEIQLNDQRDRYNTSLASRKR
jgi:hypothetical protein